MLLTRRLTFYLFIFTAIITIPLLTPLSCLSNSTGETFEREQTLIFGRVSTNPKKHIKDLQPVVDYVASKMGDVGIKDGAVLFAKDIDQMIKYLKQGRVDWITETPFPATLLKKETHAEIALLRWKKKVRTYSTIFITKKDSNIKTLGDLVGKKIALEDRGSTTGYFLPISLIIKNGIPVAELFSPRESAHSNSANYIFAKTENNISAWVYQGLADAGAMSNLDWEEDDRVPLKMKEELHIFHQSMEIPRAVEIFASHLNSKKKSRLTDILINMHKDPSAENILRSHKKTTKFEEIDMETRSSLNNIEELVNLISVDLN